MEEQVKAILEKEIKPMLAADGGSIKFVALKEGGVVEVELQGACAGCPGAQMTLRMGVERLLKQKVPGITKVVAV